MSGRLLSMKGQQTMTAYTYGTDGRGETVETDNATGASLQSRKSDADGKVLGLKDGKSGLKTVFTYGGKSRAHTSARGWCDGSVLAERDVNFAQGFDISVGGT